MKTVSEGAAEGGAEGAKPFFLLSVSTQQKRPAGNGRPNVGVAVPADPWKLEVMEALYFPWEKMGKRRRKCLVMLREAAERTMEYEHESKSSS